MIYNAISEGKLAYFNGIKKIIISVKQEEGDKDATD